MKFPHLNRISHLRSFTLILGFALMSVNQAQSLDSMIAFSSDRDNPRGYNDIFVMKPNGSQVHNLTNNPMSSDIFPAWSPDGTKIAFSSSRDGDSDIYVMDADGKNLIRLTRDPEYDSIPNWSPDGRKIAFTSRRDGNFEVYVMNADGENQIRLTQDPWNDGLPSWSPDGRKIAFMSHRNSEIFVMDVDGKNFVRLTRNPASDAHPSWSPDGQNIAFSSDRAGTYDIYVMDAEGKDPVRLTPIRGLPQGRRDRWQNLGRDLHPSWSSDGRKIAFTSNRDGNYEIYIMDADGGNPTNLTQNAAKDEMPAWSPGRLAVSPKTRLLTLWATIKYSH
jgi:Tol biopolymer transport system component